MKIQNPQDTHFQLIRHNQWCLEGHASLSCLLGCIGTFALILTDILSLQDCFDPGCCLALGLRFQNDQVGHLVDSENDQLGLFYHCQNDNLLVPEPSWSVPIARRNRLLPFWSSALTTKMIRVIVLFWKQMISTCLIPLQFFFFLVTIHTCPVCNCVYCHKAQHMNIQTICWFEIFGNQFFTKCNRGCGICSLFGNTIAGWRTWILSFRLVDYGLIATNINSVGLEEKINNKHCNIIDNIVVIISLSCGIGSFPIQRHLISYLYWWCVSVCRISGMCIDV